MKAVSVLLYSASLAVFAISLLMPATSDWLGFFWAAYSLAVVARGPQGAAAYPLHLLVSVANVLVLLSPFAFANAARWGAWAAHLLVLAAVGSAIASGLFHTATWSTGWYGWCGSLVMMSVAIYLHRAAAAAGPRAVARPGRALHSLRRTGTDD